MNQKCDKCGYEWKSQKPNPKQCPSCKRYDWCKKKCAICDKEVKIICSHHISYKDNKTVKLCNPCHRKIHTSKKTKIDFPQYVQQDERPKTGNKKIMTITIDEKTKKRLIEKFSKSNNRSLSNYVEKIIDEGLDKYLK